MPLALNNNKGSVKSGRMKKRFQRGSVLLEKQKNETKRDLLAVSFYSGLLAVSFYLLVRAVFCILFSVVSPFRFVSFRVLVHDNASVLIWVYMYLVHIRLP